MNCATCPKSFREPWPHGDCVIRCGADGDHYGNVTVLYRQGFENCAEQQPVPAWCPRSKEEVEKVEQH